MQPTVYMLASRWNGTLYVGVTSDLAKRVWEHRTDATKGFTAEHQVHRLVWYEPHERTADAIVREKNIKAWKREWKICLIEAANPERNDLYGSLSR